ncbi:branched-chain amino acid ABC transporter permease [Corticibacter populi]|uniref:Branched-chain amino acid ABC transporter permease n=1 Tax=Corticibacter populi TaxID=1550736 RepID=A0A3M6QX60_9BURK|nr:branched-chain amino acid ABC transporter permease [Corticibacter populi]RMX07605.1 branched-chain amino acid ABC transporter permease [Corticibacter populi]RZS30104.1 amino acid/amide ABC transporter membrane protein 1 (HAAT family) [Corticibacter populi]
MNLQIIALLGQDGISSGAIYALVALSIILVFSVTRILLIPLGEFVAFSALTMAAIQAGRATIGWLILALALAALLADLCAALRQRGQGRRMALSWRLFAMPCYAVVLVLLLAALPLQSLPMALQALLTLAAITPMGPLLYRLFFQPVANASGLLLMIIAIAVHVSLVGVGLLVFGPEGMRTEPFSDGALELGFISLNSQTIWVLLVSVALILALYVVFGRTLYGKALRATAVNRLGAQLMGISPALAGKVTFSMAAFMCALSGILIAPLTTLYYDSGFIISLKGFVGAIIGGLASYPVAAIGAVAVGLIESFSTFWASSYKEVIVFTLILPFLMWRSFKSGDREEEH